MKSAEVQKELAMSYSELVDHLLDKYGPAQYDYFCNETCRSKNRKVSRTDEGLFCHHIDENKEILLSKDKVAANVPFEYQKANRLVYCNVLEHLILHIKIVEENEVFDSFQLRGIGGAVCFLCPQINDYYNGYHFEKSYLTTIYSVVKNNFADYIKILKYFLKVVDGNPLYEMLVTREILSYGWGGQIVKKVYEKIS